MKWFGWLKRSTYESEVARGKRLAIAYAIEHGPVDCRVTLNSAREDRDFCEGIEKGFSIGWIDVMKQHLENQKATNA